MATILEPPPTRDTSTAPGTAPATGTGTTPQPAVPPAQRDFPWPAPAAEETPPLITPGAAAAFVLFGFVAMLLLGMLLGSIRGFPGLSRAKATGGTAAGAPSSLDLSASEFKFSASDLKIDGAGQLTVTLQNKGVVEHDFSIEGVPGKAAAKPGETGKGTFNIAKPGTYTFFCSLPGHKDAGMVGTLTVS